MTGKNTKMLDTYNNIGIGSIAILSVCNAHGPMELSKCLLILPLITNKELIDYLSRKNITIQSLEEILMEKPQCFTNFNNRFLDQIITSISTINLVCDLRLAHINKQKMFQQSTTFSYDVKLGERARKILNASDNLANIISNNVDELYLNLRVQI